MTSLLERGEEMAAILITGNTGIFTEDALVPLTEDYKIVIAGKLKLTGKHKNIISYDTVPTEEKFARLFDVYSFQAVLYVTGYVDGGNGSFGEMQYIGSTMNECRRGKVEKLILLSTVESRNFRLDKEHSGVQNQDYLSEQAFSAAQAEELCRYFSGKSGVKTVLLRLPYLAGRTNRNNFLGNIFAEMEQKENIIFPHRAEDRVDFVSLRDLIGLLGQIAGETEDESGDYFVTSGYRHSYGELHRRLQGLDPELQAVYENSPDLIPWPDYPTELRIKYGFIPLDNVIEDIEEYYEEYKRETGHGKMGIAGKLRQLLGDTGKGVFQYIELLLVFLLAEVISYYTSDSVYFKFVDVRLFYIMIMGTMHGMKLGLLAALLESIVLVRNFGQIGMDGTLLFYNVENWIPFAVYLMAGSITGYIKNKKTDELNNSRKEYALLRNKYIFLNDVYHSAIENKSEYKKQILGFKDSFGKIFDAVQKLECDVKSRNELLTVSY
ncbi:MAG: hypothetical protein Q4D16_19455, partial [Eubacteriales bacterium]|nr:hypothetical protein [Eubacteriales bacterium]